MMVIMNDDVDDDDDRDGDDDDDDNHDDDHDDDEYDNFYGAITQHMPFACCHCASLSSSIVCERTATEAWRC